MNRIIRLNALHISSQSDVSKNYCDRSAIETDLVSEMALIHDKNIAFIETGVTLKTPIKTHNTAVESSEVALKNTENRLVRVEEFLSKSPKAFSLLATIRSIAFFTTVVVWSWTGRIEQVSQVRGKVVALGEQSQILPHHLDTIDNTVVTSARKWKPIEVVAELNGEFSTAEVEDRQQQLVTNQMQSNQVDGLINSSRLLAHTRTAIKVLENLATRASQTSAVNNKPTDIIDLRRNSRTVSKRVVSTTSSAKSIKKISQVYRS
ncbi:hypothetical protein WA1_40190 [Scytonema hofmannii PCC 7110]|uniref:Uncharacterized protein n=1 Tax=Scytonema hofmannii PCC 7110 TaxID=128403 RepID=A0A139WZ71_9CYAN|nr:hypothetical protein [Scytonema hofmannii]KYC37683.1 hypothetical protein WA1_40190 [Scytonema hofmannii PCC 7110]